MCVAQTQIKILERFCIYVCATVRCPHGQKFSKVCSLVILYSKLSGLRTFQNLYGSRRRWDNLCTGCEREYVNVCVMVVAAVGCRRPIGGLIVVGHFPQKSPIISGSFAENDL